MGTLRLPRTRLPVSFLVDGKKVRAASGGIELSEGHHRLRAVSEPHWIDVEAEVDVRAGQTVDSGLAIPELATIVVQAFPPNGSAYLRRPGGEWKLLDDVPVRLEIAPGRYEVRVTNGTTGETQEKPVALSPGANPPIKFTFAHGAAR